MSGFPSSTGSKWIWSSDNNLIDSKTILCPPCCLCLPTHSLLAVFVRFEFTVNSTNAVPTLGTISSTAGQCLTGPKFTPTPIVLPAIVFSEVYPSPSDASAGQEFIELHNIGPTALDISNWAIVGGVTYLFPANTIVPADGYVIVCAFPTKLTTSLFYNTAAMVAGPWNGALSGQGETLELRDSNAVVVTRLSYLMGFPWPVSGDLDPDVYSPLTTSIQLVNPDLGPELPG